MLPSFIFLIISLGVKSVFAGERNKIELSYSFFMPHVELGKSISSLDNTGLSYRIGLYNTEWSLGMRLASAETFGIFQIESVKRTNLFYFEKGKGIGYNTVGEKIGYNDYYFADVFAAFTFWHPQRHAFSAVMGISGARGTDVYLTEYEEYWENGQLLGLGYRTEDRKALYFGLVGGLRYDYSFWKNRLNAGMHLSARKYFGWNRLMWEPGLQIGYNF